MAHPWRAWMATAALTFLLTACGAPADGPSTPTPSRPDLSGAWRAAGEGTIFPSAGSLRYLRLDGPPGSGGTGGVFGVQEGIDVLTCAELVFAVLDDDVVSISSSRLLGGSQLFVFERRGADTLRLTNSEGVTETFTREGAVPAEAACESVGFSQELEGLELALSSWSELESDGSLLRVLGEDDRVYPVSPSSGTIGLPQDLASQYRVFVAMQGSTDYWAHCACGGSQEAFRMRVGGVVVDEVHTDTDLGVEIGVRAGAFDGSSLWLFGTTRAAPRVGTLLQVDAAAEPDVLLGSFEFDAFLRGLTFHDGSLWGLVNALGTKLIRIDPALGRATRTVALPDLAGGDYQGVASHGGAIYLLWRRSGGDTFSLFRVDP